MMVSCSNFGPADHRSLDWSWPRRRPPEQASVYPDLGTERYRVKLSTHERRQRADHRLVLGFRPDRHA